MKQFDIYFRGGKKQRIESEVNLVTLILQVYEGSITLSGTDIIQVSEVLPYFK